MISRPCEDHTRGCDITHHTKSRPKSVISQVCAICDEQSQPARARFVVRHGGAHDLVLRGVDGPSHERLRNECGLNGRGLTRGAALLPLSIEASCERLPGLILNGLGAPRGASSWGGCTPGGEEDAASYGSG